MVRKGRVAIATAVVGLAALIGGSFLMPKDYLPSEERFPRTQVEDLVVNTNDEIMTYAELTPKQATDDMYGLVFETELEEAWVEVYKKGPEKRPFFEVGIDNYLIQGRHGETGVKFNEPLITELRKGQKHLRFWHDHPQLDYEKALQDERRFGMATGEARKKYAFFSTYCSFPDGPDLASMVFHTYKQEKEYWNSHIWNKPTQEHCVRGEYGAMCFSLNKAGKKHFVQQGDFMGTDYLLFFSSELLGWDMERFLNNEEINIESVCPGPEIKELVETWNHSFVELSFTPNEEMGLELTRYERFGEWFNNKFLAKLY